MLKELLTPSPTKLRETQGSERAFLPFIQSPSLCRAALVSTSLFSPILQRWVVRPGVGMEEGWVGTEISKSP